MATEITRSGDGIGSLMGAKLFVVGAGSGMGKAIALMAAARGAKVAIAGRNQEKLDSTASLLGGQLIASYSLNLADLKQVSDALAQHGPYDHIISTAADLAFKPFLSLSDQDIQSMLNSKLYGPINIARSAEKSLKASGSVLYFSGLAAYRQGEGSSLVGAVNIALESLVANLAIEMSPKRFNVISPGVVNSETWDGMAQEEKDAFFSAVASSLPVQRVGEVSDLAHAALAVLENGFINGTVINVDGGGRIA